jgi:hypothetical protein
LSDRVSQIDSTYLAINPLWVLQLINEPLLSQVNEGQFQLPGLRDSQLSPDSFQQLPYFRAITRSASHSSRRVLVGRSGRCQPCRVRLTRTATIPKRRLQCFSIVRRTSISRRSPVATKRSIAPAITPAIATDVRFHPRARDTASTPSGRLAPAASRTTQCTASSAPRALTGPAHDLWPQRQPQRLTGMAGMSSQLWVHPHRG